MRTSRCVAARWRLSRRPESLPSGLYPASWRTCQVTCLNSRSVRAAIDLSPDSLRTWSSNPTLLDLMGVVAEDPVHGARLVLLALEHRLVVAPEQPVPVRGELSGSVNDDRHDEDLQGRSEQGSVRCLVIAYSDLERLRRREPHLAEALLADYRRRSAEPAQ